MDSECYFHSNTTSLFQYTDSTALKRSLYTLVMVSHARYYQMQLGQQLLPQLDWRVPDLSHFPSQRWILQVPSAVEK